MSLLDDLVTAASAVREATQEAGLQMTAEEYVNGINSWLYHTIAPYPPIWNRAIFEASALTVVSYFLVAHGFYEEATALQREVLDGFLTRLYWDTLNAQGQLTQWTRGGRTSNNYWEWETGRAETYPRPKEIWDALLKNAYVSRYENSFHIKQEIDTLLSLLNKYVHGRPQSRHTSGDTRSSLVNARFKQEEFNNWFARLRTIYGFISVLSVLSYPELLTMKVANNFESLDPEAMSRVKAILFSSR
jgi:hypothetical protein